MRTFVALAFVVLSIAVTDATSSSWDFTGTFVLVDSDESDCLGIDTRGGSDAGNCLSSSYNQNVAQRTTQYPQNCDEAVGKTQISGIHMIQIRNSPLPPFFIYCQADPNGGPAWAIIQRRQDGSVDFYREWDIYKNGFGNIAGEYFIGLDRLHALTHATINELWIEMKDFEDETRNAYYDSFAVGDENEKYALKLLGTYSGNAGDSLRVQQGMMWSTKDVDNDQHNRDNCAEKYRGAWWHLYCHKSNLNGLYSRGKYDKKYFGQGINWFDWHGYYYSLKYTHMAIRWKVVV